MKKILSNRGVAFWTLILLSFIVGTILRSYLISSQIIIDDEWHGINYVIGRSFQYVFTNHGLGANSIPMNLYRWFLLNTVGWSELLLRAPTLIAGVLSLIIFPIFVVKMFNRRTTVIFSFLLSMSPVLIFYSRMSRPYGIVVVLSFVAFFSLLFWMISGKRKFVLLYIATAVLAIYFHLYASIAVLTPLGIMFILKIIQRYYKNKKERFPISPSVSALIYSGFTILIFLTILLLPAHIKNLWWLRPLGHDRMTFETITGYLSILSGTSNKVMVVIFLLMFVFGLFVALKENLLFIIFLIAIFALYFIMMTLSHQEGSHAAIQVARYSISVVPLVLIVVAFGMDRILFYLHSFIKTYNISLILIFLIPSAILINLFTFGPLLETYHSPNNFTNHSAFQDSYKPHSWTQSRSRDLTPGLIMDKKNLSSFYFYLATLLDTKTIIEYPLLMGDPFNLYYYYQHFHKKNIIVGYLSKVVIPKRTQDYIYGNFPADYVMSRLLDLKKVKFNNMVDMENIEGIKRSTANYIVLHKHLTAEMFPYLRIDKAQLNYAVVYLIKLYRKYLGKPFFEDKNIIVFRIC